MNAGIAKWPTGIFAAWYPVKDRAGIDTLRRCYAPDNPPTLTCEFLRTPVDGETLAGGGLLICNPPYVLGAKLDALCQSLRKVLAPNTGAFALDWWIRER